MTLAERAAAYNAAYPDWPAGHLHVSQEQGRDVLYGIWVIGNDYRNKTEFYGAYPNGYLGRLGTLFPDRTRVLHAFSGSLPPGAYTRIDKVQPAEIPGDVVDLPALVPAGSFDLACADPPYSHDDAEKYKVALVDRGKAMRALAHAVAPGGFCAWLDTVWPMHGKDLWLTVGRIAVVRSTNHRVRMLTIFARQAGVADVVL